MDAAGGADRPGGDVDQLPADRGGGGSSVERRGQRAGGAGRLNAMLASTSQARLALNRPEGRCARGPFFRSAMTCSMIACRRWSASACSGSPPPGHRPPQAAPQTRPRPLSQREIGPYVSNLRQLAFASLNVMLAARTHALLDAAGPERIRQAEAAVTAAAGRAPAPTNPPRCGDTRLPSCTCSGSAARNWASIPKTGPPNWPTPCWPQLGEPMCRYWCLQ